MRLFPSDYAHPKNPGNNDKGIPPDNNPRNDTVDGGYQPDTVDSVVFPYRGSEQHGVPADRDPWQRAGIDDASTEDHSSYSERIVPDPVPVYLVSRFQHEIKTWNTQQINVGQNPREIVGRNLQRTKLRIRNLHATTVVYIGRANMASYLSGYPLDPSQTIEMNTTDELWGLSADPAQTPIIAVLQEYTVNGEQEQWH